MYYEAQCGYYPDRLARNHEFSDPGHKLTPAQVTRLINKGYRRFATEYYRPFCKVCHECTPYRVLVEQFRPNRSMRRVRARNAAVNVEWAAPQPTQEKFELYMRYQLRRHRDSAQPFSDLRRQYAAAMMRQMYTNPPTTLEITTREEGRLIGFAIFDRSLDSLSAVYSVYEPELPQRSFGTLHILLAMEKARAERLPYLNLGLWLQHHPKMAYKKNFQPAQIYRAYRWYAFGES